MNIAFDLDGVLVDVKDYAEKYLVNRDDWSLSRKKDWKAYFACTLDFPPIEPMVEFLRTFISGQGNHTIYFITGRPESNRELTKIWLGGHVFRGLSWCNNFLFMRKDGDSRSSAEVKLDLLKGCKVDLLFDDDPDVIEAALKEGYTVVQVHGYRYTRTDMVPPAQEGERNDP